ncbi:hypothetical protein JQF37_01900 [Pseudomonas sp. MIL9]|uniref:hypothetical protein n=1 Tax=Pseudomonas sp. MIL9 TaxID=2807620 RepID=UPI0019501E7D|nr:hypothetical protein [Pseudomonas sp. MIL9]MBM6442380.1 hypothetical protein [Pseudomonas sp. MIL9]
MNDIAQWLGYGVMVAGGALIIAAVLFFTALACVTFSNKMAKALRAGWDLKTLRDHMRQLETEGKVSKKTGVKP